MKHFQIAVVMLFFFLILIPIARDKIVAEQRFQGFSVVSRTDDQKLILAQDGTPSCTNMKAVSRDVVEDLRRVTHHLHLFLTKTCSGYWTYGGCFEQHGEQIRPISVQVNHFSDALENHIKTLQRMNLRGHNANSFQGLEALKKEAQRNAETARERLEKAQEEAARGSRTTAARLASEGGEALKKLTQTLFQICDTTSHLIQTGECEASG